MKPLVRKLRGAQRVAALQADAERLHAAAEELRAVAEAAAGSKETWRYWDLSPEEQRARSAADAFRVALDALYKVSPKRAIAVAAKLGLIKETWAGYPKYTGKHRYPAYRGINRYDDSMSAAGLPVGDEKTQRKLKKIVEAKKQAKKRGR